MEALAARLAAEAADEDARAGFAAAIGAIFDDRPRRGPDYLAENAAFHDALMALAGNAQLRELATRLGLPLIMAQVGDILTPDVLRASVEEHRAIAEAILKRDPEGAASAMRAHLQRAARLALDRRAAFDGEPPPSGSRNVR
jgi:DNA-binding GntR family transcriptional regulator